MMEYIYGVPKQPRKHRYPTKRKYTPRTQPNKPANPNPDVLMSKRDQESVCAVRTSAGLSCRNCKYYQHKYCLYDQGLMVD